jgi:hypothetical protein
MATYTVKTLITTKAMGNAAANIATWQYQNTGSAESACRSMAFTGQAGATGQVNVQMGVTGATAIASALFVDSYPLTASSPYFVNGWYTVPVNSFLCGYANSATVNGLASGVIST